MAIGFGEIGVHCQRCSTIILGMSTWFSADLHLGHANIIEYCDRPYASVRPV